MADMMARLAENRKLGALHAAYQQASKEHTLARDAYWEAHKQYLAAYEAGKRGDALSPFLRADGEAGLAFHKAAQAAMRAFDRWKAFSDAIAKRTEDEAEWDALFLSMRLQASA